MIIKKLQKNDINIDLFTYYKRKQMVSDCYRKIEGEWKIVSNPFIDEWDKEDYKFLVTCLLETLEKGGVVLGVFEEGKLLGFSSIENELFGKNKEYLQLSSIHISNEARNKGVGRKLFQQSVEEGRKLGAKKLYISAHSAVETIGFYKKMGCELTKELNYDIFNQEPYDVQLEYVL